MSSLRPIVTTTTTTINNNNTATTTTKKDKTTSNKTRIMRISEPIYEKLKDHSRKYHDQPISYDEIIEELCIFYNKNNDQKYFLT